MQDLEWPQYRKQMNDVLTHCLLTVIPIQLQIIWSLFYNLVSYNDIIHPSSSEHAYSYVLQSGINISNDTYDVVRVPASIIQWWVDHLNINADTQLACFSQYGYVHVNELRAEMLGWHTFYSTERYTN